MNEVSLPVTPPMRKWAGRQCALMECLIPLTCWNQGADGVFVSQFGGMAVVAANRNPSGIESGPKTDKGLLSEPGNPAGASFGMTKATGERTSRGRSLRSSPRAGKPSTWRRETVNTVSRQEGDILCPSR